MGHDRRANRSNGRAPRSLPRLLRISVVTNSLFGGLLTFVGTTSAGAAANGTVSLSPPSISAVGGSTTVTVTLGSGEGSPTDNVTVSITSGGGTATAANGDTTASVYTATITAGDIAGTYMVSAVDNTTGTEIITSASLTEVPGSADKLVFTIEPSSSATSNKAFGTQPAVTVEDLDGNVVTGSPTSVTLALATPNGATLSCNANPVTTDDAEHSDLRWLCRRPDGYLHAHGRHDGAVLHGEHQLHRGRRDKRHLPAVVPRDSRVERHLYGPRSPRCRVLEP